MHNFTPLHLKEDYRRLWTNSSSDGLFPDSGWLPHIEDTFFRAVNLLKYSHARREWNKTKALHYLHHTHDTETQHMQRHEKYRAQITEYSNAASRCHTSNKALQAKSWQHLNKQYCPRSWVTASCCAQPGAHCDPVGSKVVHNTQAAPGAVLLSLHSRKNFICSQFPQRHHRKWNC